MSCKHLYTCNIRVHSAEKRRMHQHHPYLPLGSTSSSISFSPKFVLMWRSTSVLMKLFPSRSNILKISTNSKSSILLFRNALRAPFLRNDLYSFHKRPVQTRPGAGVSIQLLFPHCKRNHSLRHRSAIPCALCQRALFTDSRNTLSLTIPLTL